MKTMKMMLAALAVSMFAAPAFAEVPVDVQKKIRDVDGVQKVRKSQAEGKSKPKAAKAKRAAGADAGSADEPGATNAGAASEKAKRGKEKAAEARAKAGGEKVEHGKEDRLGEGRRPMQPEHARPSNVDEGSDIATKRSPNSAKGLDRLGKAERKHLLNLARINRLAELAAQNRNTQLQQRVEVLREKEARRYARALNKIDSPDMGE